MGDLPRYGKWLQARHGDIMHITSTVNGLVIPPTVDCECRGIDQQVADRINGIEEGVVSRATAKCH